MLRMRLTRVGAKKRPSYRVIVADSRAPRDGRHVDILGFYDPMTKPRTMRIDTARAVQWLRHGAQPSDRVRILLRHAGVLKAHEEARLADKRERRERQASEAAREGAELAAQAERKPRQRRTAAAGKPPKTPAVRPAPRAAREKAAAPARRRATTRAAAASTAASPAEPVEKASRRTARTRSAAPTGE